MCEQEDRGDISHLPVELLESILPESACQELNSCDQGEFKNYDRKTYISAGDGKFQHECSLRSAWTCHRTHNQWKQDEK